jgi:hypothetical protein
MAKKMAAKAPVKKGMNPAIAAKAAAVKGKPMGKGPGLAALKGAKKVSAKSY